MDCTDCGVCSGSCCRTHSFGHHRSRGSTGCKVCMNPWSFNFPFFFKEGFYIFYCKIWQLNRLYKSSTNGSHFDGMMSSSEVLFALWSAGLMTYVTNWFCSTEFLMNVAELPASKHSSTLTMNSDNRWMWGAPKPLVPKGPLKNSEVILFVRT